ncbi:MAG: tripartite tricarboxylate transporter substrate binding protein [Variibacter sp.]|nr:tripartite tricarboxylate transporter substrate binding protein [Variibacter sp.]
MIFPPSRRHVLHSLIACATAACANLGRARADDAPIRVAIAFPPGGTSTASMRPLQQPLKDSLGAAIELDYFPGAGGNVATLHVVRANPDGRTLLFGHAGPLAINHHLLVQTVFDPQKDLAPVAMVVRFPIVVSIAARHRVATLPSVIALARQKRLVVGSSGNGSIQHLASELFGRAAQIEMVHIPFAGGGPLQQAFERGAIDVMLETGSNVVKHVTAGTLKAVAVLGRERLGMLPDVPTIAEAGFPALDVSAWFGLLAPAATPAEVTRRLSEAVIAALARTDVGAAYAALGGLPGPMAPAAFARFIAEENTRWGKVIRDAGISPLGVGSGGTLGSPQ